MMFHNLQCLEVRVSDREERDGVSESSRLSDINLILKSAPKSLTYFLYKNEKFFEDGAGGYYYEFHHQPSNKEKVLSIPGQIKWCCIDVAEHIKVDLSHCDKLLGLQLVGLESDDIVWSDTKYLIPYCCVCYADNNDELWRTKIRNREFNVRLICLMQRTRVDDEYSFRTRCKFEYDGDEKIERVNIDEAISESRAEQKCIVLDEISFKDEMLIKKILKDAVKDDNLRLNVLERCQRWWYFGTALWIKKNYIEQQSI